MNKKKIKIGDKVKVISGGQKGIVGSILSFSSKNTKVLVEGILPRMKFVKTEKEQPQKSIEIPTFIDISNVMGWDKETKTTSKIGIKIENGKKIRFFKKTQKTIS